MDPDVVVGRVSGNVERVASLVGVDGDAAPDLLRASAITALHSVLLEAPALEEFVGHVVQVAADDVAAGTSVTITLLRDGRLTAVAASDARASRCDEVEYATGDGPCLDSIRERSTLVADDLRSDTRWPAWRAETLAQGFESVAAVPRRVLERFDIALNLYADRPHAWDAAALARAEVYADEIARSTTLAVRTSDLRTTNEDLRQALASRAVIDQAIGVLMAQNRCDPDSAFSMLRSASQNRNVKLRDLARSIVEGIGGPGARDERDRFTERPR